MELTKDTSANQLYKREKRAGLTDLDFKSWLQVKKSQHFANITGTGTVPVNTTLDAPIQNLLGQIHQEGGLQIQAGSRYTFGVSNQVWMWTAIGMAGIIVGVIIYKRINR